MWLGGLIRAFVAGRLGRFVVDIILPLRRAVDAVGPVQTGVEPLRAVCRGALAGQHVAHFIVIGFCIGPVAYTHLRAHETVLELVCRLLLEKKKKTKQQTAQPDRTTYVDLHIQTNQHNSNNKTVYLIHMTPLTLALLNT